MALTKLTHLINPEVLADMIQAELPALIRFTNTVAEMDYTLQGRPGDTITLPVWKYIGHAADLAEGVDDIPVLLDYDTDTATVKKVAKAVELTDEAVLSGYGDPVGEAGHQLALSIAGKIDADVLAELKKAVLAYGDGISAISYEELVSAIALFEDEVEGEPMFLFIAPAQRPAILMDENFIQAAPEVVRTGVVGYIAGCEVRVSKQLDDGEAIIAKPNAVKIYAKRNINFEDDRNVLGKSTIFAVDQHYVAHLADEGRAIILDMEPAAQGS